MTIAHRQRTERAASAARIRMRALDGIAFAALLLQITEWSRPFGLITGLSSAMLNLVFTGFFLLYAVARWRYVRTFLNRPLGFAWMSATLLLVALMLGLQILDGTVTAERAVYWIGYSLLFAAMMVAAVALWNRHGTRLIAPFFITGIAATWLGFAINLVNYGFVREVMTYTGNDFAASTSFTRISGFYPHPNMAGIALCIFLACLVTDERFMRSNIFGQAIVLSASIAGVAVTGSRTSLLLLALVVMWYFVALFRMPGQGTLGLLRVIFAPALLLGAGALALYLFAMAAGPDSVAYSTIVTRLSTLTTGVSEDASVGLRISIIDQYVQSFWNAPWLGNGPEFAGDQIEAGVFTNVSQNAWLEWAVRFGFVYAVVVAVALVATLVAARREGRSEKWVWPRAALIVLLLVAASFSIVDLLWLRSPVVALGMVLGTIVAAAQKRKSAPTPSEDEAGARSLKAV